MKLKDLKIGESLVLAMAYDRQTFKDKLESKLIGGLIEFYKVQLAKESKQTKWVNHWTTEYKRLFEVEFVSEVLHEIRGFKDRRKVIDEVLKLLEKKEKSILTYAKNTVEKDYKIKVRTVPNKMFESFLNIIENVLKKLEIK